MLDGAAGLEHIQLDLFRRRLMQGDDQRPARYDPNVRRHDQSAIVRKAGVAHRRAKHIDNIAGKRGEHFNRRPAYPEGTHRLHSTHQIVPGLAAPRETQQPELAACLANVENRARLIPRFPDGGIFRVRRRDR